MPPEPPGQSPFASTNSSGAGAPISDRPEPPRLGILHLMVLTACVAVWMGVTRIELLAAEELPAPGSDPLLAAAVTLHGIGGGAALSGLILFVARRLRRIPFPIHPGEYLLVMSAISVTLGSAVYPVFLLILRMATSGPTWWSMVGVWIVTFVVNAPVFIWTFVRVKIWRWRVFLLSIPICQVAGVGLMSLTSSVARPSATAFMISSLPVAASIVLLAVVVQDHLQGKRYPWSHWLGVALRLCLDAARIILVLWIMLAQDAVILAQVAPF